VLTVRAARADDLGAIEAGTLLFSPEVAFGRSRWHYLLNQAKGRTLLLQDEKAQVMGYLSVLEHKGWDVSSSRPSPSAGPSAVRVGTPPAGAGDPGRARGRLGGDSPEVADANPEARALYQGLGFRPGVRLPDYYGPGQHAHRLVLALGNERQEPS
jgi:ribosomal protein S18 acetylase RimI-like enzyme